MTASVAGHLPMADALAPALTLEELLGGPASQVEEDPVDDEEFALLRQLTSRHFVENRPEPASFPAQATRAMALVRQPDVDLNKLTALVAQDPVQSAHILRVANSAAYSRGNPVSDFRTAITRIGLAETSSLILGLAAQTLFDPTARAEYRLFTKRWNTLFHHAMTSAMGAAQLAIDLHKGQSGEAFMGGLFHHLGKSIALRSVCDLVLTGKSKLHPEDPAIDRLLEAIHVEVGAEMHATWRLPTGLGRLCARHHDEVVPDAPENVELHLVRVASGFAALRFEPSRAGHLAGQITQSLGVLGLGARVLPNLRKRMHQHAQRVSLMFEVADPGASPA